MIPLPFQAYMYGYLWWSAMLAPLATLTQHKEINK